MCINTSVDDTLILIMKQCNFINKYHHSKIGEYNFTAIQWTWLQIGRAMFKTII